ncbi:Hypothetical protein D9617_40g012750 [Elsinoe fawcettii]|nr:Hypothetical protein D9617_40g012750 [Elsinoe fawcettii]
MDSDANYARGVVSVEGRWGFVVYRCTYGDDDGWARCLHFLNENTRSNLEAQNAVELMRTLNWSIQSDPDFEGIDQERVRQHFAEWCAENRPIESSRSEYCLMIDRDCMESILNAPQPPDYDREMTAYVYCIKRDWTAPTSTEAKDEGWFKLAATLVAPRAFSLLDQPGYSYVYKAPPAISDP